MTSIFDFETPQEAALKERVARLEAQLQFYKELYGDWAEGFFAEYQMGEGDRLPPQISLPLFAQARISRDNNGGSCGVVVESLPLSKGAKGTAIGYYVDYSRLSQASAGRDPRLFAMLHDKLMRRLARMACDGQVGV